MVSYNGSVGFALHMAWYALKYLSSVVFGSAVLLSWMSLESDADPDSVSDDSDSDSSSVSDSCWDSASIVWFVEVLVGWSESWFWSLVGRAGVSAAVDLVFSTLSMVAMLNLFGSTFRCTGDVIRVCVRYHHSKFSHAVVRIAPQHMCSCVDSAVVNLMGWNVLFLASGEVGTYCCNTNTMCGVTFRSLAHIQSYTGYLLDRQLDVDPRNQSYIGEWSAECVENDGSGRLNQQGKALATANKRIGQESLRCLDQATRQYLETRFHYTLERQQ